MTSFECCMGYELTNDRQSINTSTPPLKVHLYKTTTHRNDSIYFAHMRPHLERSMAELDMKSYMDGDESSSTSGDFSPQRKSLRRNYSHGQFTPDFPLPTSHLSFDSGFASGIFNNNTEDSNSGITFLDSSRGHPGMNLHYSCSDCTLGTQTSSTSSGSVCAEFTAQNISSSSNSQSDTRHESYRARNEREHNFGMYSNQTSIWGYFSGQPGTQYGSCLQQNNVRHREWECHRFTSYSRNRGWHNNLGDISHGSSLTAQSYQCMNCSGNPNGVSRQYARCHEYNVDQNSGIQCWCHTQNLYTGDSIGGRLENESSRNTNFRNPSLYHEGSWEESMYSNRLCPQQVKHGSRRRIELIAQAILSRPNRKMLESEILRHIRENNPEYKRKNWRAEIRQVLNYNRCFIKLFINVKRAGHPHYWSIHPACMQSFLDGSFCGRHCRHAISRFRNPSIKNRISFDNPTR